MFTARHTVSETRTGTILKVALSCAWALAALEPAAQAQSAEAPSIKGTWILSIRRVTQDITFSALQSFTTGGVTLATGTIDRIPPPPISPLYGSWSRAEHDSYVATICFFVFDPSGNAILMIKTNETFRLTNDNTLVGSGTGFVCDLNGDHCVDANLPITFTGKRVIPAGASD